MFWKKKFQPFISICTTVHGYDMTFPRDFHINKIKNKNFKIQPKKGLDMVSIIRENQNNFDTTRN